MAKEVQVSVEHYENQGIKARENLAEKKKALEMFGVVFPALPHDRVARSMPNLAGVPTLVLDFDAYHLTCAHFWFSVRVTVNLCNNIAGARA